MGFTGSTDVGKQLRRLTAGTGKKISLELGGKSPVVVFDDCDIDSAVEGVVDAIWFNQGQVCSAGSRLIIQETIYEVGQAEILKKKTGWADINFFLAHRRQSTASHFSFIFLWRAAVHHQVEGAHVAPALG